MSRIAIIGPGAVGGTLAAWLGARGRHDVTLCARTPIARLRVATPEGPIEATPRVLTGPESAEAVDWVLATTKTYDVAGAARWLGGLLGPDTRLAVLQNGVEHRARFAGLVEPARIVPGIVDIPAERTAPGGDRPAADGLDPGARRRGRAGVRRAVCRAADRGVDDKRFPDGRVGEAGDQLCGRGQRADACNRRHRAR